MLVKLPKSLTTVTAFPKLIMLFLFIFMSFAGFMIGARYQAKVDSNTINQSMISMNPTRMPVKVQILNTSNWKTYTNSGGWISIQYPPEWSVKESHTYSNRTIDNPKEINKVSISGKEGSVNIKWGPIGFGGGCGNWEKINLINKTSQVCKVVNPNGESWAGINNGVRDYEHGAEASAAAHNPLSVNAPVIEAILSTLKF